MKKICLALSLLALAGCSGDLLAPSGNPAKLYRLTAPPQIATGAPQANWQLLIDAPNAALDLNSARIAIAPAPDRIDYYADVAWADRPPAMLQELLLQSFDRSGKIAAVQRQSGGLRADFILDSDVQDFQVDADSAAPAVHVRVTVWLVRARDRAIVASRSFDATVPTGSDFDGAIAAFNGAVQGILPQIVDWTLLQGSRNL